MLDKQSDEFRKEIGDTIVASSESSVPTNSNISIEKEVKQGFIQIKSMLQAVVLIYKNLGVMRGLVQKHIDELKNNTNILALQNILSAFNQDLARLNEIMHKHLDIIKVSYNEIGKMFKSIEEQSIYDTNYEVYNKNFLLVTVQSEVEAIKRYGYMILPMDECLTMCALDLSGRPYLVFNAEFTTDSVGGFDTEMVKEFFHAITYSTGMNLHIKMLEPGNNHHMIEGIYKAFAKALDQATIKDERITDVLSTKGTL